jgi:hypothetical protein
VAGTLRGRSQFAERPNRRKPHLPFFQITSGTSAKCHRALAGLFGTTAIRLSKYSKKVEQFDKEVEVKRESLKDENEWVRRAKKKAETSGTVISN